jgi:hypothetical protein
MHFQPNSDSAPASLRPRVLVRTRPPERRPVRRPEPVQAGLTNEQIRRIVIEQIG